MRFVDRVQIHVESGAGGAGCVSFRRETHVPRGGPNGGDGGSGGDVILRADPHLSTLIDFRFKANYKAKRGQHGMGSLKTGKSAPPVVLRVPPGTVVMVPGTGEVLADLVEGEFVVAHGGIGGRGNARFVTSTRQAPDRADPGRPGEVKDLVLELKLIADVGIVGLPNAGKSTFISRVSAARPKIADYPFTTLVPNLGVVRMGEGDSFVVADVPGLVEGASRGVGLGLRFLRHVERTSVLLHLVSLSPTEGDPVEAFRAVKRELAAYSPTLPEKPFLVALNKVDLLSPEERKDAADRFRREEGVKPFLLSGVSGEGLGALTGALWRIVSTSRDAARTAGESGSEGWSPLSPGRPSRGLKRKKRRGEESAQ